MLRPLRISALLSVLVVALTACGSSDASSGDQPDARPLASPVTVEHRFGSTTIDSVPERIVTIDLQWTDVLLAMGVEPVGYTVDPLMPDSTVPWQELPEGATALSLDDGVPVEEILALEPDLVLSSFSLTDQGAYDLLSARAPTIVGPPGSAVTPWQDLVRTAGEFLDQKERAADLVTSVEGSVDDLAAELPGLAGKTFELAQYIVGDSMYVVADEGDGSSVFFSQLGMTLYPPIRAEGERTGDARVNLSTERADLLRADLLVFLVNGGDESDLADIPGFDQLPGTVAVLDYPTIVGLNTPTPLSVPYALDQLRPHLEDAAA